MSAPAMAKDEPVGQLSGPCVMVIFGASGDLTKRKLLPALCNLAQEGLLPKEFAVVGVGRSPTNNEEFRKKVAQDLQEFASTPVEPNLLDWLSNRVYYHVGNFQDPTNYRALGDLLGQVDLKHGTGGNYFFYLATAPEYFAAIARQVGAADLAQEGNGCYSVVLINDVEANAYGIATLGTSDFAVLHEGRVNAQGNAAVISPGTGLGEAGLYWDGSHYLPFATEGGHASFAPNDELQDELLRYLRRQFGHVSWERVLSGPGLFNIYKWLRDTGRCPEPP